MRQNELVRVSVVPRHRWMSATSALVLVVGSLMLSGCNTTKGVGQDVSATGQAVTRGANDVKNGL